MTPEIVACTIVGYAQWGGVRLRATLMDGRVVQTSVTAGQYAADRGRSIVEYLAAQPGAPELRT